MAESITMFLLDKDTTVIRVADTGSFAVITLSKQNTLDLFAGILRQYGYKIVEDKQ